MPLGRKDRVEEYGPLLLLAVLGLLWALHFWRHFVFPNSDYFSFVTTGRKTGQIGSCRLAHVIPDGYPQIAVWRILPEGRRSEKEFLANPRSGVVE
jgi:hypothetical protein